MFSLEELVASFCQISRMGLRVMDKQFHTILMERYCSGSSFCNAVDQVKKCTKPCIQKDEEAFRHVEKHKVTYAYTCPFGVKQVIVPIFNDSSIVAYFYLVMGFEQKDSPEYIEEIARSIDKQQEGVLCELIRMMPHNYGDTQQAYQQMLVVMAECVEKWHLLKEHQPTLGKLIKIYIDDNIDKKITLAGISKQLHRSTVSLTEKFKEEYGVSIMQYVNQQRMEMALQMIEETELKINEIACICGFQDVEYFSRCFKKKFSESPNNWRKKRKE